MLLFLVIILIARRVPSDNNSFSQKQDCPFQCCTNSKYYDKQCPLDYECRNNNCYEKDTDGDGLSDRLEKQIGTNPQLYDTDGDTLSDYKEYVELKTNPLSKNTDNDRYDDNEDPNPVLVNSANITGKYTWNANINFINLGITVITGGTNALFNPDLEIAKIDTNLNLSNIGNDFTAYILFDLIYLINETEIEKTQIKLGKLDVGQSTIVKFEKNIKIKDVPEILMQSISSIGKNTDLYKVKIDNISYEKFN